MAKFPLYDSCMRPAKHDYERSGYMYLAVKGERLASGEEADFRVGSEVALKVFLESHDDIDGGRER